MLTLVGLIAGMLVGIAIREAAAILAERRARPKPSSVADEVVERTEAPAPCATCRHDLPARSDLPSS